MEYLSDKDTATQRVCGTCGKLLPLSDFYKDGKTAEGDIKYRRDCKNCYKDTRVNEALIKAKRRTSINASRNK
jgi:hypothetical protein